MTTALEEILTFEEMSIEYKKYSRNAHVLNRANPGSAGYDPWATESKVLKPWSRELIRFDWFMAIPKGYYGRIFGRSGLANTHGITVHNGTIDSGDQGIACVVFFNLSNEEDKVETGNCIVLIIE